MRKKPCLYCEEPLEGRIDKLFCTPNCKSSYHYQKSREQDASLYNKIDVQLKLNRRILKLFNKAGKATVRKEQLLKEGFNPKYFTNYWKNKKGDVYLFCYEYGFLERKENGRFKYVLVQWQDYMN
ncbi:MAG: hypothetical protein P8P74_09700 [Crocinitomicaceae bacterium]|nr:hypothetical protein [Crocinitomicaceae bacterium]